MFGSRSSSRARGPRVSRNRDFIRFDGADVRRLAATTLASSSAERAQVNVAANRATGPRGSAHIARDGFGVVLRAAAQDLSSDAASILETLALVGGQLVGTRRWHAANQARRPVQPRVTSTELEEIRDS
jgi:hypothetical protein